MTSRPLTTIGAATDRGRTREVNQDSIGTPLAMRIPDSLRIGKGELLAVADGMGGHAAGEDASQRAISTLYDSYYSNPSPHITIGLREAFEKANARVHVQAASELGKHGMGTTLVAAVIRDNHLVVANVGDSRAYLVRRGQIHQITQDHSWVAEAVATGVIDREQANRHAHRNIITRAIGHKPEVKVDIYRQRLQSGDAILLCSDGLTNEVQDGRLAQIIAENTAEAAAMALVSEANKLGGRDNISAVVARIPSQLARSPSLPVAAGSAATIVVLIVLALLIVRGRQQDSVSSPTPTGTRITAGVATTAPTSSLPAAPSATNRVFLSPTPVPTSQVATSPLATPKSTSIAPLPAEIATRSPEPAPAATATPPSLAPLGVALQLGQVCGLESKCRRNGDALRLWLELLGHERVYATIPEIAQDLGLDADADLQTERLVQLELATAPLECHYGFAHAVREVTAESNTSVFVEEFKLLRELDPHSESPLTGRVSISGFGPRVNCVPRISELDPITLCVDPQGRAALVARWARRGEPVFWPPGTSTGSPLAIHGSKGNLEMLVLWFLSESGQAGQLNRDGSASLLVVGNWRKTSECQFTFEPADIGDVGPAIFVEAGDVYIHFNSREGGQ